MNFKLIKRITLVILLACSMPAAAQFNFKKVIGGASKAVTYVLTQLNIPYVYVSRKAGLNKLGYEELTSELISTHTLIINTTPLGMLPDLESYPNIPYNAISEKHLLYDLVYNPVKTQFLLQGEARGATIKNGLEMLMNQAEAAYIIWNQ